MIRVGGIGSANNSISNVAIHFWFGGVRRIAVIHIRVKHVQVCGGASGVCEGGVVVPVVAAVAVVVVGVVGVLGRQCGCGGGGEVLLVVWGP